MLVTLNIVLGLIFVLLLFSLLASTVMEVIAAALSLRGKHLENFLRTMMVEHFEDFSRHPLFKQISNATSRKSRVSTYQMPSWVNRDTFTAIVGDMLDAGDAAALQKRIEVLDEGDVKRMLQFLLRRSGGDPKLFIVEMEHWFDEVMERASDWYKRKIKWWLFAVGMTMAVIFNVDTIKTYQRISQSAALQGFLVEMATDFEAANDSIPITDYEKTLTESIAGMETALERVDALKSPLGLGWESSETGGAEPYAWVVKILGLLLTGIAVTFGAPFWFDLLKKVLSVRSAMAPAAAVKTEVTTVAPVESYDALPPREEPRSITPPSDPDERPLIEPDDNSGPVG